ncbi:MAG: DsrH/TusB family sulfur relay protein [Nitrospirae bacterium]|nr:DsrH/TusB family sulfur relay protein [Nitrospirota bacterium]
MLVIIRNAPDTPEGRRGVKIARDMSADIVLLQNGVYFMQKDLLEDLNFHRTAYVLEDDKRLRGLKGNDTNKNIKDINYDALIDLMAGSDKVVGMF